MADYTSIDETFEADAEYVACAEGADTYSLPMPMAGYTVQTVRIARRERSDAGPQNIALVTLGR